MLKINFLGDSITEGALASSEENTYVCQVGKMLNAEVRNYGIGGSRFAKQIIPSEYPRMDEYFASRVDEMKNDADYVIVFGGTNDFGHGDAPIGEMEDNTPDTYLGSINYLIDKLLKYYKKEQIKFILPLHRKDENNPYGEGTKKAPSLTLDGYVSLLERILNKRDVEYFNFREEMGGWENNPLLGDGLHPNDKGHKKLATLICDKLKK